MRFLSGSPDIPDDLIRDVTDNNAVFLCGAGVSMRAKFPSFKQLAEQIYIHLGDALCGRGDERAFDPLHHAGIDVELIGNAADAHSSLQSASMRASKSAAIRGRPSFVPSSLALL